MLLSKSLSAHRFQVIVVVLFCFSAVVLAQSETPDTCKIKEPKKPAVEQKQELSQAKVDSTERKEADDRKAKTPRSATLESIFLLKNHTINKL